MEVEEASARALEALQKIAEEIPSGVSFESDGGTVGGEIRGLIAQNIASEIKCDLEIFWEKHNVEKKLQDMKNLKQKSRNKELSLHSKIIWKEYEVQQLKKAFLEENINALKSESSGVLRDLRKTATKIEEHFEEFKKVED